MKEKTQKDSHLTDLTSPLLSLHSLPFSHFPFSNSAGTIPPEISAWLPLNLLQDFIPMSSLVLAGVAHWIERRTVKQGVICLIPSPGTCLGCRPGPQWGAHRGPHIDVSLPLFLLLFPSL